MERRRAYYPGHVQPDRLVAGQVDRQLPEAGHGVLGETGVGVIQGGKVQAELFEHGTTIQPFELECLDDP
ncbi:hypothetical protein D9M73_254550 [compost metagenome]